MIIRTECLLFGNIEMTAIGPKSAVVNCVIKGQYGIPNAWIHLFRRTGFK
jgi:hypothetical protein